MLVRFTLVVVIVALGGIARVQAEVAPTSQPATTEPADFQKLKEIMPARLFNQPQHRNDGEKVSAGAMLFSHATAEYGPTQSQDDSPSITLEVIDYVATKAMADAATGWQKMQIDRSTDDGSWQKTTKLNNQPAFMTFESEGRNGQLQVFVAGRFYVHLQTTNIGSDDFKKIAATLPIEKLVEHEITLAPSRLRKY